MGCSGGTTVSYTLTNPDRWFYTRSCSVFYGNCLQSVGSGENEIN
jgi:hypothetical protein